MKRSSVTTLDKVLIGSAALSLILALYFITYAVPVFGAPSKPTEAQEVIGRKHIIIDLTTKQLHLYRGDVLLRAFPVAVGAEETPTPTGSYTIINKLKNPWYTPRGEEAVAPMKPENPIGSRWMGIDKPHYGIHGTNEPDSLGTEASKGCIRLHNDDVNELYELVDKGTPVLITATAAAEGSTVDG